MFAYFNTINWPMVYVNFDLKQLSDESFEKYTIDYLAILIKAQTEKIKLILVYNLDNMKLPISYIKKQVAFNKTVKDHNTNHIGFVCIVSENRLLKSILKMFFSIQKDSNTCKVFKTHNEVSNYLSQNFGIITNFSNENKMNYDIII